LYAAFHPAGNFIFRQFVFLIAHAGECSMAADDIDAAFKDYATAVGHAKEDLTLLTTVNGREPAAPKRSFEILGAVSLIVVGMVIGAAVSWPLFFGALESAAPAVDSLYQSLLPALSGVAFALILIVPLTWWGLRRAFRRARGSLDQIVKKIADASRAAVDKNVPAVTTHTERAVLEAISWYMPVAARRFVMQTSLALLVTFGGLLTQSSNK
jgi:hypothetical protein